MKRVGKETIVRQSVLVLVVVVVRVLVEGKEVLVQRRKF